MTDAPDLNPVDDAPASRPIPRAGFQTLRNRLRLRSALARKLAVMDLIRRQEEFGRAEVRQVLTTHLEKEANEAIRQRITAALEEAPS